MALLMAASLLLSSASFLTRPPAYLPPPRAQLPSSASAVQRLAISDASRCYNELCNVEAEGLHAVEEGIVKAHAFIRSRTPLISWATSMWVDNHVRPNLPPVVAGWLYPRGRPETITLRNALKPISVVQLTRSCLVAAPGRTIAVLWELSMLWASRRLQLPGSLARRQLRRDRALERLASAYEAMLLR